MIFLIRIGGEAVEIPRDPTSQGYPVYPRAFVCPWCLARWATIGEPPFAIEATPCQYCPATGHPVPGSLLDNFTFGELVDWELLDLLPASLLRREFDLHIRQLDTETHSEHTTASSHFDPDIPSKWRERSLGGSDWNREDVCLSDPR